MNRILKVFFSVRAAWIFAACTSLCLACVTVWFGALNQDEGWYLYAAQMVNEGKMPYKDFFFTQGPVMPVVYSVFAPVWQSVSSPVQGLLGGRLVTLLFGVFSILSAMALARRMTSGSGKNLVSLILFSVLGCNIYHLYFTTIPKTYALGGFFLISAFLLLFEALRKTSYVRILLLAVSGASFAFASGTRISLILVPAVVGLALLIVFKRYGWSFFWFGLGLVGGLFVTYGMMALNDMTREGLLAAQWYHASRGGFDFFFAAGSAIRLLRGYASLVILALMVFAMSLMHKQETEDEDFLPRFIGKLMLISFAAVFLLQISAPFPYDDYQVPIMGLVAVPVAVAFVRCFPVVQYAWFSVGVALLVSGTSSMLQDWTTYAPDRFWSSKMECSELAKLRKTAREINMLDPGGKTILTQDIYLAIETARKVPQGMEMGPFSLFPKISMEKAIRMRVHNLETISNLIDRAECSVAAMSGYGFAIAAPECGKVPEKDRKCLFAALEKKYTLSSTVEHFGQNDTSLKIYTKKGGEK